MASLHGLVIVQVEEPVSPVEVCGIVYHLHAVFFPVEQPRIEDGARDDVIAVGKLMRHDRGNAALAELGQLPP